MNFVRILRYCLGSLILLMFLAVHGFAPPVPLNQDFTTGTAGWTGVNFSPVGWVTDPFFPNGALAVFIGPPNFLEILFDPARTDYTDFTIETMARKAAGPMNPNLAAAYGLVFRGCLPCGFYWFAVTSTGYYGLWYIPVTSYPWVGQRPFPSHPLTNVGEQLINWTWSGAVAQGNAPNKLTAVVKGNNVDLFINDAKVASTVLSGSVSSGWAGLALGTFEIPSFGAVTVDFDYVRVTP